MKKTVFTGSGVAIVTPMNPDLSVNYDMLEKLIELQIAGGTKAIVSCGTTGESSTLNHDEHCRVIEYTIQKVAGRIQVIAGTGNNNTKYAVKLSKEAEAAGADALLCVTPYYNKTSQLGMIRNFTHIADQVTIPIILYNIPSRTGCAFTPETYFELSKHPNIVATKEASGNFPAIAETAALCGEELAIYSGDDNQIIPIMALGGKGVISVLANICPQVISNICELFLVGKLVESRKLCFKYIDLMANMFIDVNPIPVKEALNQMGYTSGECRMPLAPLSDKNKEILTNALRKHNLI